MNAADPTDRSHSEGRSRSEGRSSAEDRAQAEDRASAEELARLLPDPAEWELPLSSHLHHKDVLMQRIDEDQRHNTPATPPRRLLRPAVVLPAAALALAGALVATLSGGSDQATRPGAGAGKGSGAVVLLNRIAAASMETGTQAVRGDQFVYVRSLNRSNEGTFNGPVKLGAPHKREVWMSQDPRPVTDLGMIRESGKGVPMSGEDLPIETSRVEGTDDTGALPPGIDRPTYQWLASLPTDPDALLKLLYARTRATGSPGTKDQDVFEEIGSLLDETVMPAKNASALYQAVARMPGVREVPDAADAAGRHGIGVTMDSSTAARSEWIFDRHTLAYLGSRQYLKKPGKPEVLSGSNAIMRRAVVDRRGMEPTG